MRGSSEKCNVVSQRVSTLPNITKQRRLIWRHTLHQSAIDALVVCCLLPRLPRDKKHPSPEKSAGRVRSREVLPQYEPCLASNYQNI